MSEDMSEKSTCWPHRECDCDDDAAVESRRIWARLDQYLESLRYVVRPGLALDPMHWPLEGELAPDTHVLGIATPDNGIKAPISAAMYNAGWVS